MNKHQELFVRSRPKWTLVLAHRISQQSVCAVVCPCEIGPPNLRRAMDFGRFLTPCMVDPVLRLVDSRPTQGLS